MQTKKITINDVASHAGVSVSTVSLVLSGKGRISSATIDKVYKTIEKLGYIPNRQASMLRGGESGVIGLIIRDLTDPFYMEITASITETLELSDKVLFLTLSGKQHQNFPRCLQRLLNQGVDGLIIDGGGQSKFSLYHSTISQLPVPAVCVARACNLEGLDVVRSDNMLAAKLATEHLIKQGYHQIAYLGGQSQSLTRAERLGGFYATLLQYGLPFRSEWIIECSNNQYDAALATEHLLLTHPQVGAIICDHPEIALGAYLGTLRTGRSIGHQGMDNYLQRQVGLLSFGDSPCASLIDPPLTIVDNAAKMIGQSAVIRLLQYLKGEVSIQQHIVIPPELVNRGST